MSIDQIPQDPGPEYVTQSDLAFELASTLFDSYVEAIVAGELVDVQIEWNPKGPDGETVSSPSVLIYGEPARNVFMSSLDSEENNTKLGPEFREKGAEYFIEMMTEIVEAVKQNGVPVEYVVFPDEGHGFEKKHNRITGYKAILEFVGEHLKGEENTVDINKEKN